MVDKMVDNNTDMYSTCSGAYLAVDQCSCPTDSCSAPSRRRLPLQAETMLKGSTRQG